MNEIPWVERWPSEVLRALLLEQSERFRRQDLGVPREQLAQVMRAADAPHAVVVSGLRRAGKSTLLAQVGSRLPDNSYYYVNFEDERFLGFHARDANDLLGLLIELFGERRVVLADEIQNVPEWERFVRRFMDAGYKFFITGSNAALLGRELGTRLTGRHVPVELFPFSFREFLSFHGHLYATSGPRKTADAARLRADVDSYLLTGGLPETLRFPELETARTLYDDVIYRDIATRHGVGDVTALRELAFLLISNPAGLVSYNKLKGQLRLGSVNTVSSYVSHLVDSWLLFTTNVFDFSVKRQQVAPKKVYAIDTGLARTVGFAFSPNTGHLLENAVFLALRRRTRTIHYFKGADGTEVDLYLPETRELIQVASTMRSAPIREREIRAITSACRALRLDRALIITDRTSDSIMVDGVEIEVRAVGEWLLRH